MANHWTKFWQQGHLTTYGELYTNGYQGKIASYWQTMFEALPDEPQVIMDIGCGNGALAWLIEQHAPYASQYHYLGVDLAQVQPQSKFDKAQLQCQWFVETDFAELPETIQAHSIDLCISQYGLEYIAPQKSVPQLEKVLKPLGQCWLFLHHEQGTTHQQTAKTLEVLQAGELEKMFIDLSLLVQAMGEMKTADDVQRVKQDPHCNQLRSYFNLQLTALRQINEQVLIELQFPQALQTLFNQGIFWRIEQKLQYLNQWQQELQSFRARLADMNESAWSESQWQHFVTLMENHGLRLIKTDILSEKNVAFGRVAQFIKQVN